MNIKSNPKVIADTCIWIEFFRTKSEISNRLRKLIANNLVVGTGIIIAELLQGTKTSKEQDIVINIFDTLEYIEITKKLWIESGNLASKLRSIGKTIPLSDILLACCAREHQLQIFTIDKHFQEIPNIKLYQ
jgi:predicted nucleic acid-binding protein